MKPGKLLSVVLLVVLLIGLPVALTQSINVSLAQRETRAQAASAGTAFSYQGRLRDTEGPVNALCDLTFELYDEAGTGDPPSGGSLLGTTTKSNQMIDDGYFTVQLDFGDAAFTGEARWLEITLDCGDGAVTLSPRQALTPSPYALALPGLWTQQNATSPNLIGGYSGNSVADSVVGAMIGGGGNSGALNQITADYGTVSGGIANTASGGWASTVGGGDTNTAGGYQSVVSGGYDNTISDGWAWAATIGGGAHNAIYTKTATIGGGESNTVTTQGNDAVIAGGRQNVVSGYASAVAGGHNNTASESASTVAGGHDNAASGSGASVGGGYYNAATSSGATIGGGKNNVASGEWFPTVGGGEQNVAGGSKSVIAGGYDNTITDGLAWAASIGGGAHNTILTRTATIAGGEANTITVDGKASVIGGGYENSAGAWAATVAGGAQNAAAGSYATVPGGDDNDARGDVSFAAGRRAKANNQGCFVWGDSTQDDVTCDNDNRWVARASGGVYFYTNADLTSGMYLSAGSSSWNGVSTRERKENFEPVDTRELLTHLAQVPITTWNYKAQDPSIRHIGPMADDFNALVEGLGGEGEDFINTLDVDGVALAAIQGLYEISQEQALHIEELREENADLRQELDALEARVSALEAASGHSGDSENENATPLLQSSFLPEAGTLLVSLGLVWLVRRGGVLKPPARREE